MLRTTSLEVPIFIFIFLKNSTTFHKLIYICLYIYIFIHLLLILGRIPLSRVEGQCIYSILHPEIKKRKSGTLKVIPSNINIYIYIFLYISDVSFVIYNISINLSVWLTLPIYKLFPCFFDLSNSNIKILAHRFYTSTINQTGQYQTN